MSGRYYYVAGILLTAAALVATAVAYPHLPDSIARHWDIHGQPNGYSPKWTLYLSGPGLMAGFVLLMRLLPWLSPKHFEVESFRSTYMRIILMVVGLLAYLDAVILWIGVGHAVDVRRAVAGGICLLFVLQGNLLGKVRRNFFIGIRTPWSVANERVWNATHRFAAKTFVLSGLAGLALIVLCLYVWALAALMAGALVPAVYSLVFYKRLARRGEL